MNAAYVKSCYPNIVIYININIYTALNTTSVKIYIQAKIKVGNKSEFNAKGHLKSL